MRLNFPIIGINGALIEVNGKTKNRGKNEFFQ